MVMAASKREIVTQHQLHPGDTGSADVQIAVLTGRINHLTGHLKAHKKDFASRRGLLVMVGKRNALLKYLARTELSRYQQLITKLGLRK